MDTFAISPISVREAVEGGHGNCGSEVYTSDETTSAVIDVAAEELLQLKSGNINVALCFEFKCSWRF